MDITRAEQITLDDVLVAPANRLKIGKSNLRLSSDLKSQEATLQLKSETNEASWPIERTITQTQTHHSSGFHEVQMKELVLYNNEEDQLLILWVQKTFLMSYNPQLIEKTVIKKVQDTGIDSIFNLNTESTSLVDVPVTTIAELPLLSATILPPPPTFEILSFTHLQQTTRFPTPSTFSAPPTKIF
ncbi:hypothetical protein Tco_0716356 [Tanacetum coccineum]